MLSVSGVFLIIGFILITWHFLRLPLEIILRFDAFHGIVLIGSRFNLFILWLGGLALGAINAILAEELYFRNMVLAYIFLSATITLAFLVLVVTATIVSIN